VVTGARHCAIQGSPAHRVRVTLRSESTASVVPSGSMCSASRMLLDHRSIVILGAKKQRDARIDRAFGTSEDFSKNKSSIKFEYYPEDAIQYA